MGIKPLELDPDDANIIYDTLINDAVGRNKNLWQFGCFCSAQEGRCSIALDGGWGTGKTFFLKQLEMLFTCYDLKDDERVKLEDKFAQYKKSSEIVNKLKPHICVYYDAWLNDNAEDPMRSILYSLIKHKSEQFLKLSKLNKKTKYEIKRFANNAQEFIKTLCQFNSKNDLLLDAIAPLENLIPLGIGKITESIKALNPIHEIEVQKSFYDAFDHFLKSLIPNTNTRLLFLIDELDRCKPTYAVQLLERIKHYLSNDRITFVFAVNEQQLQHTIKAFYGEDFNANQYLDKFFDYRLSLPRPDMKSFNSFYGMNQASNDFDTKLYMDVCSTFIQENGLSLRDSIKYWNWVEIVCKSFKGHIDSQDITWKFVVYVVVPIVLGLKITSKQLLDEFLNGNNPSPLRTIIAKSPVANRFLFEPKNALFERTFDSQNIFTDDMLPVDEFYDELLGTDNDREMQIVISPFEINSKMSETVFTASNFMADFIKYDTNTEETANG